MTGKKEKLWPKFLAGALGAALAAVCFIFLPQDSQTPVQGLPSEGLALPVIAYHNVLSNDWEDLEREAVSVSELEADLQFLQKAGCTPVTPRELWDFVRGLGSLPERPVVLLFHDGFDSMETLVLPLLEKYQFRAAAAIVGQYADLYSGSVPREPGLSYLSWDQLKALQDSGLVEIANHSYAFHEQDGERQGMKKLQGESNAAYRKALSDDLLLLQERCRDHLGSEPLALIYPYGLYSPESRDLIREFGFSVAFTGEEGVSLVSDKESLLGLQSCTRTHGADREAFFKKLGIP